MGPNLKQVAHYLYEIGHLKRLRRSGWWRMGVRDPETVAEHCFRTAIIGYILASLEGADAERTASICLFHDAAEARVGDISWLARRYLASQEAEPRAFRDQVEHLPEYLPQKIAELFQEQAQQLTREGQLAREADILECLLQAREYAAQGYAKGMEWAQMCREGLKSEIARTLADYCLESDPGAWFESLQQNPHL
ncbi:HD family hydrolase [Thermogemmatispora sp.]|uniref:HD domain-containing protein n=1 Tax=Thermogemmatispora sp. TaxID=1968838 RepID=UPI0035E443DB